MTSQGRILLNVVASYGRSIFALVCGLFTARWVLMMLGEVDYGLYGVIGGLVVFFSFLNGLLATAVGRFYAFSVGEAQRPGNESIGLEECRKWFNAAICLHTVVPCVLVAIGYPCGRWAIENFLEIPANRIFACIWVWRFVCVSCLFSMVNVPYYAMYTAKQNIAELTIYSFSTTALNLGVLYYMVSHPSDWLVRYAFWMMLTVAVPQLIIGIRGHIIYSECKLVPRYLFDWSYIRKILSFAGYRLLNGASMISANQGQAVVVNKYLGLGANAAMTIGNQVSAQSQALSMAIAGAFYPAITNAAGAGKLEEMRELSLRTSKFSVIALLMFTIPLCLEIIPVLDLWLKHPPAHTAELCVCILMVGIMEKLTDGHWMAIFAVGRIAGYQMVACLPSFFALIFGWILIANGVGVVGVGIALLASKVLTNAVRLYYGVREVDISVVQWLRAVLIPSVIVCCCSFLAGMPIVLFLPSSFLRIILTSTVCVVALLVTSWNIALSYDERLYVKARLSKFRCYRLLYMAKHAILCQLTKWRHGMILRRIRSRSRSGGKIRVLFLVHVSSKWKCQSLYDWMVRRRDIFEPVIGVDKQEHDGKTLAVDFEQERKFYEGYGCKVENITDAQIDFDIVFYQEPWCNAVGHGPYDISRYALPFYIPYYVPTHDTVALACGVKDFHEYLFRQIVLSKAWSDYYSRTIHWWNYCGKLVGLGHTMLDQFKMGGKNVYTIYAPHFSVRQNTALTISTFLLNGRYILDYAKMHPEMNWVFKPHPRLRDELAHVDGWSRQQVDAYYSEWESLGIGCYTGEYPKYFNLARALITDCSSFLGEFAATGKPIIHLIFGLDKAENTKAGPPAQQLFETFYQVQTMEDLRFVFRDILEDGNDPMRDRRIKAAREMGLCAHNSAEAIGSYLADILNKGGNK